MRIFEHFSAENFDEACKRLKEGGKSVAISGGTDLIGVLKAELLEEAPETVVNLKTIQGASYIEAEEGCFRIGALTKLVDIAESAVLRKRLPILSEAAVAVATPTIRNIATIGGTSVRMSGAGTTDTPTAPGAGWSAPAKGARNAWPCTEEINTIRYLEA